MRFASRLLAAAAVAALALSPVPAAAKAEYGAWGIVLSDMDPSVKPGDDFYMYVNGGWDKRVSIPADKSGFSDGDDIEERAENDLHEILEAAKSAAPGSADRKTGDFYASFMDEAAIEAKGVEPVKPLLAEIEAIKTPADLARAFGETQRGFGISPIFIYIEPDSKKPAQYAAYFYQSGLGLPDRDYYLKDTPENLKYREAYRAYIAQLLTLAGVADPAAKAESIFALEAEIAKIHWPAEETRDAVKTYNPIAPSALNTEAPGLDWTTYLVAGGLSNAPQLVVGEKSAIIGLAALVGATPIETWKAYLTFHTLDQAAQYLPKAFDEAYFNFNKKTLGGQETQRVRVLSDASAPSVIPSSERLGQRRRACRLDQTLVTRRITRISNASSRRQRHFARDGAEPARQNPALVICRAGVNPSVVSAVSETRNHWRHRRIRYARPLVPNRTHVLTGRCRCYLR